MSNWLVKERQYLNYGIRPLQPAEAIFFIKAALIFLNFVQYHGFIYKIDIMIIEITILCKKEFTDTLNFYPSLKRCQLIPTLFKQFLKNSFQMLQRYSLLDPTSTREQIENAAS